MIIFDDGSLTSQDKTYIEEKLSSVHITQKDLVDSKVRHIEESRPYCTKFRNSHWSSIKLIDIPIFLDSNYVFVDSDVLFVRDFEFNIRPETDLIYMNDMNNSYSAGFITRRLHPQIKIPNLFNCGFMYLNPNSYDIDYVEWFLSKSYFKKYYPVIEQTCWASFSSEVTTRRWNPEQVLIPTNKAKINPDRVVALHFVTQVRSFLQDFPSWLDNRSIPSSSAELETLPPSYASFWKEAKVEISRKIKNLRHRMS